MKNWWQQLNIREQRLIAVMSLLIAIFILYSLIWQPLNDALVKNKAKLERTQDLFVWVQENTDRYTQAKRSGAKKQNGGSLSSIVTRTSRIKKITITRMQPQGEDLQVWIDEISFEQLLSWLEQLATREGLQVKSIDLSKTDQQGAVRVRRLQLGKI